jgi:two-component system, OmpR family, phosphate regulon sensor histidine kinase PhoR
VIFCVQGEESIEMMKGRSGDLYQPSILVVDDEERIREGCTKVLTRDGFEVVTADCGEVGLKMIEQRHFDIILLDLMMPSLSGFDVLSRAKTLHPDSVIIVISGYATLEHSIEAMKEGAFDFIPKPFTPEQLRLMVNKAIEYNRALQDIAREKSRMRVLINRLSDGVMATDNQKQVVLANPAFLRMVGCESEVVIGRQCGELICNNKIESMIDKALSMHADEFVELADELNGESSAGQAGLVFSVRCIPFRDRVGRNLGSITLLHDITAQKRMDQIKSDFVSMVSHEIRSPLNSVLMQIQVVLDGLAGQVTEKQQEILARVFEKVKGLVSLSSELLDISRIESGLISQEKEQVDMAEILTDQVVFHRARAEDRKLSLDLGRLSELSPVLANRRNMEEVLSNLISNAINYTPEGGQIRVSADMEGDYLRVSVADTGLGIPKQEQEKIFAPFYRVKDEKTRFIVGTGLGLSIVKSIVEAHNGWIRLESEPGRGSTFHVYIPSILSHEASVGAQ